MSKHLLLRNLPSRYRKWVLSLGLKGALWQRSYEHETQLQFSTRLSVRDADCDRNVTITMFGKANANYPAQYFQSLGHAVDLKFVDIGIKLDRKKAGRPRVVTDEERRENQKKSKRESAQRRCNAERLENPKPKAKTKCKAKPIVRKPPNQRRSPL